VTAWAGGADHGAASRIRNGLGRASGPAPRRRAPRIRHDRRRTRAHRRRPDHWPRRTDSKSDRSAHELRSGRPPRRTGEAARGSAPELADRGRRRVCVHCGRRWRVELRCMPQQQSSRPPRPPAGCTRRTGAARQPPRRQRERSLHKHKCAAWNRSGSHWLLTDGVTQAARLGRGQVRLHSVGRSARSGWYRADRGSCSPTGRRAGVGHRAGRGFKERCPSARGRV